MSKNDCIIIIDNDEEFIVCGEDADAIRNNFNKEKIPQPNWDEIEHQIIDKEIKFIDWSGMRLLGGLKKVEIGFRSDGIVVWRYKEDETTK